MTWRRAPGGRPTSAESDAKLDSGRRGEFSCVMSSVCLSVCLFAGVGTAQSTAEREERDIGGERRDRGAAGTPEGRKDSR